MRTGYLTHALALLASSILVHGASAAESTQSRSEDSTKHAAAVVGGSGYRTEVGKGEVRIPVVLVHGTPYEMGWHLGRLTRDEIKRIIPPTMARFKQSLHVTDEKLQEAWTRSAAFCDERFKQELAGSRRERECRWRSCRPPMPFPC